MADEKKKGFFQKVVQFFKGAVEWVKDTFADPAVSATIREDLGLDSQGNPTVTIDDARMQGIQSYLDEQDPDEASFEQTVEDIKEVVETVKALAEQISSDGAVAEEIVYQLFRLAAVEHLRIRLPWLYAIAKMLHLVQDQFNTVEDLDVDRLLALFKIVDPEEDPETGETEIHFTELEALRLTDLLAAVVIALEVFLEPETISTYYGWDHPIPGSTTPEADRVSQRALTVVFGDQPELEPSLPGDEPAEGNGDGTDVGARGMITLVLVSEDHGGPGLVLSLGGGVDLRQTIGPVVYDFSIDAGGAFEMYVPLGSGPEDFEVSGSPAAGFSLDALPAVAGGPAFLIGNSDSSRLEIGSFAGGFEFGPQRAGSRLALQDIELIVLLGDGDGFLAQLPGNEIRLGFDLGFGADTERGFTVEGGAELRATLPVHKAVFGVFRTYHVELALGPSTKPDHDVALEVSGAFGLDIGPFAATVDRIGFELHVAFRAGNLGVLDVDFGFKPPSGIGLVLDAGPVKGGGYLYFDTARSEYAGALELKFGPVSIKALGILTTRLPGGAPGWSLLLMIYGEFPPIELGFFFTLEGAGGIVGVQHGISLPALQSGLRTGVLDDVLFPRDPVADAPRLLNQLRAVFPITPRALTIGPVLRIGWGKPTVMTITLGILFQVDNVFQTDADASLTRVTLVGQLRVELPPADERPAGTPLLLKLLVDILGDYDLEEQALSIDARLRDSKVANLTLTGSLAVRARFGDRPSFLLAAGGFHPKFRDIPPDVPKQDRLGVKLKHGIVDIGIEGYFAVTSNTVQVGALAYAQVKKSGFEAKGWIGFDALFELEPRFRFLVDVSAGVTVKYKGFTLAEVRFVGTFEGPGRWKVHGSVSFSVLWWDPTIPIDEEWGDEPPAITPGIDAAALVSSALSDSGNWSAQLPRGGDMLVTLRSIRGQDRVLAHPLGSLRVEQKVMPLKLEIDRIGSARPIGARMVDVVAVEVGGVTAAPTYHDAHFARAQYLDLTDEQKLDVESFEPFPSGVSVGSAGPAGPAGAAVTGDLDYETIYLEREQTVLDPVRVAVAIDLVRRHARYGGTGRSVLRPNTFLAAGRPEERVRVTEPEFVAAGVDTMTELSVGGVAVRGVSSSLVEQAVGRSGQPGGTAQVIESYELEAIG